MATPNTSGSETEHHIPGAATTATRDWWNFAIFSIGGVAALGLVVVLFGAYLTPNDTLIVSGTIIMLLAVIAWILAACYVLVTIAKRWFTPGDKKSRGPQPR